MALSPVGAFGLGVVTGTTITLGIVAVSVRLLIRSAARTLHQYREKLAEAADRDRRARQAAEQVAETQIPSIQWPEDESAQRWIS